IPCPRLLPSTETESQESSCAVTSRRIAELELAGLGFEDRSVPAGFGVGAGLRTVFAEGSVEFLPLADSANPLFVFDDSAGSEMGFDGVAAEFPSFLASGGDVSCDSGVDA